VTAAFVLRILMAAVLQPVAQPTPLRTVTVGGHRLAYRRLGEGSGQPVLLVHGITTHSFLWEGVLRELSARGDLDLLAVDLLGCGASDKPLDASYSLKAHADLLARFCGELGLGRIHLVGHDLGGGVGQIMAVRQPGLLRSLTLLNCVGYDLWPVQPITALRTPVVRQLMLAAIDAGAFTLVVRRGLFHKELVTPALMAEFRAPLATTEGRKAFVHFARCLDNSHLMELVPELRRLRVPTAVVWGLADLYLTYAIAERLVADIPGARLIPITTAGHFSPLDEPGQVAAAVRAHVDGHRG
jgi:pimeloyl-ACP methyl ester carboxylesterase